MTDEELLAVEEAWKLVGRVVEQTRSNTLPMDKELCALVITALTAQADRIAELQALAAEILESAEDWNAYVPEYFREKHGHAQTIAGYRAALQSAKGKRGQP